MSNLRSHRLPELFIRAPETTGPVTDVVAMRKFRESLFMPSGVTQPTTLVINLEGRFLSVGALVELVLPLAQSLKSDAQNLVSLVVCSGDKAVQSVIGALAKEHDLSIYLAPSTSQVLEAKPVGTLTTTESETLSVLRHLGGRATVAMFAEATQLATNAATNRLSSVRNKGFIHNVERSGRQGQLFLDPRVASPVEDVVHPTNGDFDVPVTVRRDVRALIDMQVRGPGEHLTSAWQEFLTSNHEYLAAEFERVTKIVQEGDSELLVTDVATKYSKMQAQARAYREREQGLTHTD